MTLGASSQRRRPTISCKSRTAPSSSTRTSTSTPAQSARSARTMSSLPVPSSTPPRTTQVRSLRAHAMLLMGLVRQAQMGTVLKYVFVPEDDSVVIGGTRYMLSVINLEGLAVDPNSRPYPPVYWPQNQYWQFANRHNPYIDVSYTGSHQSRAHQSGPVRYRAHRSCRPRRRRNPCRCTWIPPAHDRVAHLRIPSTTPRRKPVDQGQLKASPAPSSTSSTQHFQPLSNRLPVRSMASKFSCPASCSRTTPIPPTRDNHCRRYRSRHHHLRADGNHLCRLRGLAVTNLNANALHHLQRQRASRRSRASRPSKRSSRLPAWPPPRLARHRSTLPRPTLPLTIVSEDRSLRTPPIPVDLWLLRLQPGNRRGLPRRSGRRRPIHPQPAS